MGRTRSLMSAAPPAALVLPDLGARTRDALRIARVQAVAAGPKVRDLQQSAGHHDVLEKVDHLILVGEIAVKEHRRCQNEQGQSESDRTGLKAKYQQQATTDLEGNGNCP